MLRDGSPATLRVDADGVKYLGYRLLTASKLDVVVTPWSGNPSLFVQFGYKPFNPEGRADAAANLAPFASTEAAGVEVVTLTPGASGMSYNVPSSTVPCWLFVAIRADGGANSSCSVLVQQRSSAPATLVDGQPQAGLVGRSGMRTYAVAVADMSRGLTITLTSLFGAPKLYLSRSTTSADATPPTRSTFRAVAAADSGGTIRVEPVASGGGVYILGIDGQGHPANFSLVARSGRSIETLRDHVQTSSTIAPGDTYFYSVDVPAGAARPTLYVAPLQASVSVALLPRVVRVDEWSTPAVQAALAVGPVQALPAVPLALPLTPGGRNMLAVSAPKGAGRAAVEVGLTPLLTPGEELVLGDGRPQFYQAAAGERVLFVYVPGPGPYSISAVELDQPPDAALQMYVGQQRHPEAAVGSFSQFPVATAEAGEVVQASFRGELEDACLLDAAACRVYVTLIPSAAANLTVTASASGGLTRLPLGRSHAVSDVVAANEYKDFALKLQPDDADDDELEARGATPPPLPHPQLPAPAPPATHQVRPRNAPTPPLPPLSCSRPGAAAALLRQRCTLRLGRLQAQGRRLHAAGPAPLRRRGGRGTPLPVAAGQRPPRQGLVLRERARRGAARPLRAARRHMARAARRRLARGRRGPPRAGRRRRSAHSRLRAAAAAVPAARRRRHTLQAGDASHDRRRGARHLPCLRGAAAGGDGAGHGVRREGGGRVAPVQLERRAHADRQLC